MTLAILDKIEQEARDGLKALKREPTDRAVIRYLCAMIWAERSNTSVGYAQRGKPNPELANIIKNEDRAVS